MNLTAVLGLLSSNTIFLVSVFLALGSLDGFLDGPSLLIVLGGSLSATVICFPQKLLKKLLFDTKSKVISKVPRDVNGVIDEIVLIARAKRKGESAFDGAVKELKNDFLKDAATILFWADAEVSKDEFRDLLETRAQTHFKDTFESARNWRIVSKFPPSFGMMGTVMGLVALLSSLGNPDAKSQIGPAMAVALITTLYGIAVNNLFVVPVGENIAKQSEEDLKIYEIVVEGIMLILDNKPTKYIEEKLRSFLMPNERTETQAA